MSLRRASAACRRDENQSFVILHFRAFGRSPHMPWAIFPEHTKALGEIISGSSERVTAIVGGALLDETVTRTLAERLHNDPDTIQRILGIDRPLGNVGPKIDMLYLLHAIDSEMRHALKGISGV